MSKDELLDLVRQGAENMTMRQKIRLTILLSLPAMVAQISSVAMQIIDASMLGHLGTMESATVGLVSTTIWLFGGLCSACAAGFSVQVAHRVGADDLQGARSIIRQGITTTLLFSLLLMIVGFAISSHLPHWLGAEEAICQGSTDYFRVVVLALPIIITNNLMAGCLRCSGNIKVPSMLNALMCVLDVIFNYILIFKFHMGTAGAAWGTFIAYAVTMVFMVLYLTRRDMRLKFSLDADIADTFNLKRFIPKRYTLKKTLKIGSPLSLERGVMCGAQVCISAIIAPLGHVAIAANTFGINIESLCYMPGYGISEAATTLVGQSHGAKREDLMRSFAWISMTLGILIMTLMGIVMALFAPEMMRVVTNDIEVIKLGLEILRIEAWAEPMFAASIVAYGVLVGRGRTLTSSVINVSSIWIVRLTLSLLLAPAMGLHGVWIAMAIELCFRGFAFTWHLYKSNWSKIKA